MQVASYPDLSQSCTQSLLAFWSVGECQWENGNLHYQKTWESGLTAHASVQNGSENDSSQESLKLILSVTIVHTIFSMIIDIHWFLVRLSVDLSVSGPFGLNFCFVCMIFVQFSLCGDSKCLYSGWDARGTKKVFLLAHLLIFTSPNGISTSPPNFLMSRIDFTVLL